MNIKISQVICCLLFCIVSKLYANREIISLMPSYSEIIFELGIEKSRIAAVMGRCGSTNENKIKLLNPLDINIENLISLNPKIIFANSSQKKIISQIRNYNSKTKNDIKLVVIENSKNVEDVYKNIETIALYLNKTKRAVQLIDNIKDKISKVQEKLAEINLSEKKPYVYIDIDSIVTYTAGGDTFLSDVVSKAGGINVFSHLKGYKLVNWESVYNNKEIDFILSTHGEKTKRKIPKSVKIITDINPDIISRDGPYIHIAIRELFNRLYAQKMLKN